MKRTTAPNSVGGLHVDRVPGINSGTTGIAEDRNNLQEEIVNPILGIGLTLNGGDNAQLWKAMRKAIKERGREVGEMFSVLDRKTPVAFGIGTEDTYFPALCLTGIESFSDISTANWPDLVPYLRGVKSIFKDGLTGEISSPGVTNWAIAANVATLTFANNADTIAFLSALLEDQISQGGYLNWRTMTLNATIGTITAGTYAITDVNASSRTVSFAFVATNGSGAVSSTAEFFAFRIAGSTTTARVWTARGLSLMGANDANGYFVSGGLRRRGFFQGHVHGTGADTTGAGIVVPSDQSSVPAVAIKTTGALDDSVNGTPRTAKETHSPAITVHIYMHGGRYL